MVGLEMTVEKAQADFALHWLLNEHLAEAHDVAEQDAPEGSWTLAVEASDGDMEKAQMLERIRRLETTEEQLSARVALLEEKLAETLEDLEELRAVVMAGGPHRGRAMVATHGG